MVSVDRRALHSSLCRLKCGSPPVVPERSSEDGSGFRQEWLGLLPVIDINVDRIYPIDIIVVHPVGSAWDRRVDFQK